ncbi:MAG: UPF0147 family protein [Candidatus Altiarchaeota archaeon]
MDLDDIIDEVQEASEDQSIPRRVREVLARVCQDLKAEDQDTAVKVTSVIYELDDIANEVNIPVHAKTLLWDVISHLEAVKSV